MTLRNLTTLAADLRGFNSGIARARMAYAAGKHEAFGDEPCACCGGLHKLTARLLCTTCHNRVRKAGRLKTYPRRDQK